MGGVAKLNPAIEALMEKSVIEGAGKTEGNRDTSILLWDGDFNDEQGKK